MAETTMDARSAFRAMEYIWKLATGVIGEIVEIQAVPQVSISIPGLPAFDISRNRNPRW
jgi:hypothetical protein